MMEVKVIYKFLKDGMNKDMCSVCNYIDRCLI